MRRRLLRVSILVVLAALAVVALPTIANAALSDIPNPIATTHTNPGALDGVDTWWRGNWGSTLFPDFLLGVPAPDSTNEHVLGTLYWIDRFKDTTIDPFQFENYYKSARPDGTHLTQKLDIQGVYNALPSPDRETTAVVTVPTEGVWYYHWRFYSNDETSPLSLKFGPTITLPFGIDMTPPRAVQGLQTRPAVGTTPTPAGVWIDTTRLLATWTPASYDDLSGVGYYQVLIDGAPLIPEKNESPDQGRVYEVGSHAFASSITLEDPPAGHHTLSIMCVDRALNEGPLTTIDYRTDPDTPTVAITSPQSALVSASTTISVVASDVAGIHDLTLAVDGVTLKTVTPSGDATNVVIAVKGTPATVKNGSHTIFATAHDMLGRIVTVTKAISVDKTVPAFSKVVHGPTPFFPIRHDGYKDTETITFTLNKRATVTLSVFDSTGAVIRTFNAVRSAGRSSFKWDGHSSAGAVAAGRFYYQLSAFDTYGNASKTGKLLTQIKSYELKKLANNRVIVIPR